MRFIIIHYKHSLSFFLMLLTKAIKALKLLKKILII